MTQHEETLKHAKAAREHLTGLAIPAIRRALKELRQIEGRDIDLAVLDLQHVIGQLDVAVRKLAAGDEGSLPSLVAAGVQIEKDDQRRKARKGGVRA